MNIVGGILLVCGIMSFLYGIMIWAIQSGSMFFAVWLALGCVFVLLAAGAFYGLYTLIPVPVRIIAVVLIVAAAAIFCFFEARIASCFGMRADDGMEYIIVLGAQVRENGPSVVLKYRLDAAYDYLERNPDTLCIVTGSQGSNEPCTEAAGMYKYLTDRGISPDRIILEEKADNTVQNLRYSREYIETQNAGVAIVTNNFHLYRALRIADAQGYENVQGIAAYSTPMYLPNNMFREFLGLIKDRLRGNLTF